MASKIGITLSIALIVVSTIIVGILGLLGVGIMFVHTIGLIIALYVVVLVSGIYFLVRSTKK